MIREFTPTHKKTPVRVSFHPSLIYRLVVTDRYNQSIIDVYATFNNWDEILTLIQTKTKQIVRIYLSLDNDYCEFRTNKTTNQN